MMRSILPASIETITGCAFVASDDFNLYMTISVALGLALCAMSLKQVWRHRP